MAEAAFLHPSPSESPLLHYLVAQLTVIKAQAQMIQRRMEDPESRIRDATQARAFDAIDLAVDQAVTQLLIAARLNRMPLEPLELGTDGR